MSPELAEVVHGLVLAERPPDDDLRRRATVLARRQSPLLDDDGVAALADAVIARTLGLGPLEDLLADPAVSEVMVNGGGAVWVERGGRLERVPLRLAAPEVELLIERVVAPLGLRVDRTAPYVDARLPDGSRVNAVVPPLAVDGPCLTIRRFAARAIPLEVMAPSAVVALLRWAVVARCNIVVSGGTGAGKTTLLNALAAGIAPGERIVTIEDTAELRLPLDHVVRLEARPPNAEGQGAISVRDLVRNALRMRPDRIVVGEVRGGECIDMLQAMNTGHDGSLTTCHANGTADALRRIETMALAAAAGLPLAAVREQVASAVDIVAHVARRADGGRGIAAVDEVVALGDRSGTRPLVVRRLAGADGLVALPGRAVRSSDAPPPDPSWLG